MIFSVCCRHAGRPILRPKAQMHCTLPGAERSTLADSGIATRRARNVRRCSGNGTATEVPGGEAVGDINDLLEFASVDEPAQLDFQSHGRAYRPTSVAIVGAGSVGTATASSVIRVGSVSDVLLNDLNAERLKGEVLDLSDMAFLNECKVRACTLQEAGQADVVVVTAGAKQRPNEPRTELIGRNIKIMESIMEDMKPFADNTILLIVANPVDILTTIAQRCSGLPHHRVIGSGTYLDTMRLRGEIGRVIGVNTKSIHVYVIGEHGDSQVATWSSATVGGVPLDWYSQMTPEVKAALADFTKRKAYEIISAKGATWFGIGACAADIARGILGNNSTVLPLSSWNEENGMYISQPTVIGSGGVQRSTLDLVLSGDEKAKLEESMSSMKAVLRECGF